MSINTLLILLLLSMGVILGIFLKKFIDWILKQEYGDWK